MTRKNGIVIILFGVGLLLISLFFSSGAHPQLGFIGNVSRMEIVLAKGEYVTEPGSWVGHYEGRVEVPLKYPLSVSVVFILIGVGVVLLSKEEGSSA